MKSELNWWDKAIVFIQNVTRFLWSVASLLAPWLVPIAPATFLGWSVYQTAIRAGMLDFLAVSAAIAAGVGLETVNIAANHAMLHLSHEYEKHWAKFGFSILLVIAYVAAGIVSMVFLDVAQSVRILGIAMFMLAPIAIASQALTMDLARTREDVEAERDQQAERERWERERQVERERWAHERKVHQDNLRWKYRTEVAVNLPSTKSQLPATPGWLPVIPGDLDEFRRLVADGTIKLPATVSGSDLERYIPVVGSDSTGRYWLRQVRNNGRANDDV